MGWGIVELDSVLKVPLRVCARHTTPVSITVGSVRKRPSGGTLVMHCRLVVACRHAMASTVLLGSCCMQCFDLRLSTRTHTHTALMQR